MSDILTRSWLACCCTERVRWLQPESKGIIAQIAAVFSRVSERTVKPTHPCIQRALRDLRMGKSGQGMNLTTHVI